MAKIIEVILTEEIIYTWLKKDNRTKVIKLWTKDWREICSNEEWITPVVPYLDWLK